MRTHISTTYLGQVDMTRNTEVKAEENFLITARGYIGGQLPDGTDCDVLIYRSKQVIHVQIIFPAMQVTAHDAKIYLYNKKNSSW